MGGWVKDKWGGENDREKRGETEKGEGKNEKRKRGEE